MSRADRKVKVAPYVPYGTQRLVTKMAIYRNDSDGDTARALALSTLRDRQTLGKLAEYFARDYAIEQTLFHGHLKSHKCVASLIAQYGQGTYRLYMRFAKSEEFELDNLREALACKYLAHTVAALLLIADKRIIDIVAPGFFESFQSQLEG